MTNYTSITTAFVGALFLVAVLSVIAYAELCTCVAGGHSQMYCVSESEYDGSPRCARAFRFGRDF